VLEELRNNRPFKLDGILNNKSFSVLGPARNRRITSVDHVISFCHYRHKKEKKKRENVRGYLSVACGCCNLNDNIIGSMDSNTGFNNTDKRKDAFLTASEEEEKKKGGT